MAHEDGSDDELEDDDGMDDPVILRGLLQCLSIATFFTLRYILDVLLTVPVVEAMSRRVMIIVFCAWNAACCAPLASLAMLYLCGSLDSGLLGLFARLMLRGCILRAFLTAALDDSMVVRSLTKRHIWAPPQTCASYTGFPIPCDELERVREFNSKIIPTMRDANYRAVRKALSASGFAAHVWHVGHAIPDPSKSSTRNEEDYGWNLFAQHAVDNLKLGHCLVSCAEARHVGAHHVQCSTTKDCAQSPSRGWW